MELFLMSDSYVTPVPVMIQVAGLDLVFHPVQIDDPTPTGRQIAKAAGCKPPDDAVVLRVRSDGELDLVRPDEVIDVGGAARFVAVNADHVSLFKVDGERFEWPGGVISGLVVRRVADVPKDRTLYLERTDLPDREIEPTDLINLDRPGIESFITARKTWKLNVHGVIEAFTHPKVVVRDALIAAKIDPTKPWQIFLKVAGQPKVEVTLDQVIDLTTPGLEKLRLMPRAVDNGEAPSAPRRTFAMLEEDLNYLEGLGLVWETVVEPAASPGAVARRWLLIKGYPLPAGYTARFTDLALEIPPTYPQAQIYGFYANPAPALVNGRTIPNTQLTGTISGIPFIGWSRYRAGQPWNPDVDNVVTQLALVEASLAKEAGE